MSKARLAMVVNTLRSAGAKMKQGKIIHSSKENEARFNNEILWINYTEERRKQKARDKMNKQMIVQVTEKMSTQDLLKLRGTIHDAFPKTELIIKCNNKQKRLKELHAAIENVQNMVDQMTEDGTLKDNSNVRYENSLASLLHWCSSEVSQQISTNI